jgi:hypothetical protein
MKPWQRLLPFLLILALFIVACGGGGGGANRPGGTGGSGRPRRHGPRTSRAGARRAGGDSFCLLCRRQ